MEVPAPNLEEQLLEARQQRDELLEAVREFLAVPRSDQLLAKHYHKLQRLQVLSKGK